MARPNPVPACRAGAQRRRRRLSGGAHAPPGARLLFGHLPAGGFPGHRLVVERPPQEVPLPLLLLAGQTVAAHRRAGALRGGNRRRHRLAGRPAGTLQRLRADRRKPLRPDLPLGQQPAGLLRRAGRQLRLLPDRRVAEEPPDAARRRRDVHRARCAGLARRTYLLQHDLPGGHHTRRPGPLLALPPRDRRAEMQLLLALRPKMQGLVHRFGATPDRLLALRGLHGLHRHLQARGHLLPAPGAAPEAGRNGKEGREGGRSACGGSGRSRTPQVPDRRRAAARKRRPARAGEEGGRRPGRDPRQEGAGTPYADRAAGCRQPAPHGRPLHGVPALRLLVPERRAAPFIGTDDPHAARILLRTRLLPPGVRRLLGGLSRRRHPEDHARREVGHTGRARRLGA